MPALDYEQIARLKKSSIVSIVWLKVGYSVHFFIIVCGFYAEFSKVLVSRISNHEDKLGGASLRAANKK